MEISSFPKVYAIGHAAIAELFQGPVLVNPMSDDARKRTEERLAEGGDAWSAEFVEIMKKLPRNDSAIAAMLPEALDADKRT